MTPTSRERAERIVTAICPANISNEEKQAMIEDTCREIDEAERAAVERCDLTAYLIRQWEWSRRTFGDGKRTLGIIDHIRKELREVEAQPADLSEWIDLAILAMDGYWRHGGKPEGFMADLQAKQDRNFARKWPEPTSEDVAVEHVRSSERALVANENPQKEK